MLFETTHWSVVAATGGTNTEAARLALSSLCETYWRRYTFLQIPGIEDSSVSSLFIEKGSLWAGLVGHPEGAYYSGGLLHYDLNSRKTTRYEVDDVVFRIVRSGASLFLATSNGIYVLRDGRQIRYRVEPDINGRPAIHVELL